MEKVAPIVFTSGWFPLVSVLVVSFRILSAPHCTVTVAVLEPLPSLPVVKLALLLTRAQSAFVVADVMWMGPILELAARVPNVQFSVWLPVEPVIEQPVNAGFSDQLRSPPGGSGSLIKTLVA